MEAGEANPSLGAWPVFRVLDAHPSLVHEGYDMEDMEFREVKELAQSLTTSQV